MRPAAFSLAALLAVGGTASADDPVAGPPGGGAAARTPAAAAVTPRIYAPRFRDAAGLLAEATQLGAGPPLLALDPVRGRLVVGASGDDLPAVLEVLAFLDAPTPQALVRLAVVETVCSTNGETGGHALFDRSGGEGPDTIFRSARSVFEPDSWLRSNLPGARPFPGVDVHLADDSEGVFDFVLRSMLLRGEAQLHACPFLLLTEGVPAVLEASVELPETVFAGSEVALTYTEVREKAGISLEALAERIGPDHVVLRLKAWLRQVVAAESESGPAGYPVLATREIEARVTVGDRRSVVVGGLGAFERARSRRGIPGLATLPALDLVASSRRRSATRTELAFVATPVIRIPGQPPPRAPPPSSAAQSAAPKRPLDS